MVKTKESGPSGDSDEFCPELSSGSTHSFCAPTPVLPPTSRIAAFRAAFPFRAAVLLQTETASSRLTSPGRCPGQHSPLSRPPRHQWHARPHTPPPGPLVQGDHLHGISLLPPMFLIFFFVCFLTFVACVAALCFTPWF